MVQTDVGTLDWAGDDCDAGLRPGTIPPRRVFERVQSGAGGGGAQGGIAQCARHRQERRVFERGGGAGAAARHALRTLAMTVLRDERGPDEFDPSASGIDVESGVMERRLVQRTPSGFAAGPASPCGRSSVV